MAEAFISYSRRDKAFVERLQQALVRLERDTWVDWQDIPLTADWWLEIREGIESSNAFIFIISPDSIRSEVCNNELDHALKNNKRFVPVLFREITDPADREAMHSAISSHNWLYFRETDDFDAALKALNDALDTDLDHVREHTRLLVRATEWERKGRDPSFLLFGREIQDAQAWMAQAMAVQPKPTELHTEYIFASQKASTTRTRRLLMGVSVALIISLILAIVAMIGFTTAEEQRQIARGEANSRATAQAVAERSAAESASLALASSAQLQLSGNNNDLAIALALAANNIIDPPAQSQEILSAAAFSPGTRGVLTGHEGGVARVSVSADGLYALSGGRDMTVRLWDLTTEQEIRQMGGDTPTHTARVRSVELSPDGAFGLSAGDDSVIHLWDIETGDLVRSFEGGHEGIIRFVTFSPDGAQFLSAGDDATIVLWDVATGDLIRRYGESGAQTNAAGHTNIVRSVAFSTDGETFLSGGLDRIILLWDVETGEILRRYSGHRDAVTSLAFSADGETFLSGSGDTTLRLWNLEAGNVLHTLAGHGAWVKSVAISPSAPYALSASDDNSVILWSLRDGNIVRRFLGHMSFLDSVVFTPDGRYALSASGDGTIRYWDLANGAEQMAFYGHQEQLRTVNLDATGQYLVSSAPDAVILYDLEMGAEVRRFGDDTVGTQGDILAADIAADASRVVSGGEDKIAYVWDAETGELLHELTGLSEMISSVAFSADGRLIAASSITPENAIMIWDADRGEALQTLTGHTSTIEKVVFSGDGQYLASGAQDGMVILWDVAEGAEIRRFEGHSGPIVSVAFNADASQLVSAGSDLLVILWDVAEGAEIRRFEGDTTAVNGAVFHDNGEMILTAATEGIVRLWNIADGRELRRLVFDVSVNALTVLPDSYQAVVGLADGSVRVYDVTPINLGALQQWTADNRYIAEFSCLERVHYRIDVGCDADGVFPTRTPFPN